MELLLRVLVGIADGDCENLTVGFAVGFTGETSFDLIGELDEGLIFSTLVSHSMAFSRQILIQRVILVTFDFVVAQLGSQP